MKKHGLTKILAVMLLLVIVATYFIEGRQGITHLAIGDVILNYFQSFYHFFDTALFILIVGAFYGLLEHVPAYTKLQEVIANKVNNKKIAVFIIIAIFAFLSSLTGLNIILLVFIPFTISLILTMGYDKIVGLLSTVGAIAIGLIGGIFVTFRSTSYYFTTFELFVGLENQYINLIPKIILLIIATLILIYFVNKYINKITKTETKKEEKQEIVSKNETKKEATKEIKKETKTEIKKETKKEVKKETKKTTTSKKKQAETKTTKKANNKKNLSAAKQDETIVIKKEKKTKIWPLITILALILIILVLGYMPWNTLFKVTIFDDFHTWITGLKIGEYTLFTNLISSNFSAFGTWGTIGTYLMAIIILIVFMIVIKFVYRIKFNDMLDYCIEGMKKMLPSAFITMLAYTILICSYNNGFMDTVITSATDKFADNIMIHSLITILGSITNVDFLYTSAGIFSGILTGLSENANLQVYALAFQSLYGLVQLVGPTSILLIICLTYTEVSYKKWFENIWRLVLVLFIIIFAIMLMVSII